MPDVFAGADLWTFLITTAVTLGALLVLMALVLFGRGSIIGWRDRRDARWLHQAHEQLGRAGNPLKGQSRRRQRLLVASLARNLAGPQQQQLQAWAVDVGLDDWATLACISRRWTRRVTGVSLLGVLGFGEEMRVHLLWDRHANVRRRAAETDFSYASLKRIDRLVELLVDPFPGTRFAARDALARLGPQAAPSLAAALDHDQDDPALTLAALDVANLVAHPVLLPAALRMAQDADGPVEQRVHALRLLSGLDSLDRTHVLLAALTDQAAPIRAAAADGLRRSKTVAAVGALSERLRDSSWEVRRAAGRALNDLGPAGKVLLRAAVTGPDKFAADMARTMLNMPPVEPAVTPSVPAQGNGSNDTVEPHGVDSQASAGASS